MSNKTNLFTFLLRMTLAATYISAYSSRINLFGGHPDGWQHFLDYAGEVNSYAPDVIKPLLAFIATALEISISLLLMAGYKTKPVATVSGILTFLFAGAMTYSFGIKEPLDYGVFVNFTAAFLLATLPADSWSLDHYLTHRTSISRS
ncbi:MAG: hypothetical protein RIG68_20195 [Imperialibacter sp.]|uniref:DoxX family protein n=1 Tax=Imperialibacter sp. TaxID=2038411 RepID=UPI0032EFE207